MPRFVLLYHECPPNYERPSHWDLMLEHEPSGTLRTWALAQLPRDWHQARARTQSAHKNCPAASLTNEVPAEALPDHRLAYLEYEGEVSNNRGQVIRIAAGTYQTEFETPASWSVTFTGEIVAGQLELTRSTNDDMWILQRFPQLIRTHVNSNDARSDPSRVGSQNILRNW
ncbi:MAG: hypothetical protein U0805_00685 [Pirellulales bacterium]